MPRYRSQLSAQDDAQGIDGDVAFVGVDMTSKPDSLAPGMCSYARNKRFGRKTGHPRGGVKMPKFANAISYGTILGDGMFSDPDGAEWLMLAVAGGVWFVRAGCYPQFVGLDEGLTLTGAVDLVQGFDGVVLFRGTGLPELEWGGDFLSVFSLVEQSGSGSAEPIPYAETGTVFKNRMLVHADRDSFAVSDPLNYTRYAAVLNEFRINQGSDDSLVGEFPYTNSSLIVFKDQSIYLVENIYGDLSAVNTVELTAELGLKARRSVVRSGADIYFLSDGGVYALSETKDLDLHAGATPVSWQMQDFVNRINWAAAGCSVGVGYGDDYLLAVPIDGATEPNAVMVLNTKTRLWQGFDTFADTALRISRWHVMDWCGQKRLFATDFVTGRVYLMYEGITDETDSERQVDDEMWTRGYAMGIPGQKRTASGSMEIRTLNPCVSVAAATDGVNEDKTVLSNRTKSRTRYYLHGREPYDASNANDDHAEPKREDYSVSLATPFALGSGVNPELKQNCEERFSVRTNGRYVVLKISNTSGQCEVCSVTLAGAEAQRDLKQKA